LTLEDAPIGSPETSVAKHHSTPLKIPEERGSDVFVCFLSGVSVIPPKVGFQHLQL
jgi:hypothetical protein